MAFCRYGHSSRTLCAIPERIDLGLLDGDVSPAYTDLYLLPDSIPVCVVGICNTTIEEALYHEVPQSAVATEAARILGTS